MTDHDRRSELTRRAFMQVSAGGVLTTVGASALLAQSAPIERRGDMPYRTLGRTGEKVSAIGLGGFHIGAPRDEQEGISLIRSAIDGGITFMDNCWDYRNGASEVRMGNALRDGYREKVFLMTKVDGRNRKTAATQIDECLKRLQTDRIDLMQLHEVIRMWEPERVFRPDGAMQALFDAKKAGKIRYIGFTGHKDPEIHLAMIEAGLKNSFTFDTVQMPLNVMDAHYDSFEKKVVPVLRKHKIGVLGMKPLGSGTILQTKTVTAIECLQYALNLPTDVVITGIDNFERLEQAFTAARTFKPMSNDQVAALLAKTRSHAGAGEFEHYKTTERFDATSRNEDWLGEPIPRAGA
ncbi:MAG: aldo/keto reductase [Candidatus Korobacteraceae bacterium]